MCDHVYAHMYEHGYGHVCEHVHMHAHQLLRAIAGLWRHTGDVRLATPTFFLPQAL